MSDQSEYFFQHGLAVSILWGFVDDFYVNVSDYSLATGAKQVDVQSGQRLGICKFGLISPP